MARTGHRGDVEEHPALEEGRAEERIAILDTLLHRVIVERHQAERLDQGRVRAGRRELLMPEDSAIESLMLRPDGRGHLFGTRWGGSGDGLVLVDYSATGLIGDPSTILVSTPLVNGLSGGVAVDTSILADGFEVRH